MFVGQRKILKCVGSYRFGYEESGLIGSNLHEKTKNSTMKYGEYLRSQKIPEWENFYLNYDKLKEMIKELEANQLAAPSTVQKSKILIDGDYGINLTMLLFSHFSHRSKTNQCCRSSFSR